MDYYFNDMRREVAVQAALPVRRRIFIKRSRISIAFYILITVSIVSMAVPILT
jgi:cell division protein FtsL